MEGGDTAQPLPHAWPSARHLKPILSAVEMVFGSAAALCAAFGAPDGAGLDAAALDAAQARVLALYAPPPVSDEAGEGGSGEGGSGGAGSLAPQAPLAAFAAPGAHPPAHAAAARESIGNLCWTSVQGSLYKATNQASRGERGWGLEGGVVVRATRRAAGGPSEACARRPPHCWRPSHIYLPSSLSCWTTFTAMFTYWARPSGRRPRWQRHSRRCWGTAQPQVCSSRDCATPSCWLRTPVAAF